MAALARWPLALLAVIIAIAGGSVECRGSDLANTVVRNLAAREDEWKKVCLSWEYSIHKRSKAKVKQQKTNTPTQKVATALPASLTIHGTKYRYNRRIFRTQSDGSVVTVQHVSCFDGKDNYTLSDKSMLSPAIGEMKRAERFQDAQTSSLIPPLLLFRPLASGQLDVRVPPQSDGTLHHIDGHACYRLSFAGRQPSHWTHLWIDKDYFVPWRVRFERDGFCDMAVTFRYDGRPSLATLSGWDYLVYSHKSETVLEAASARNIKLERTCDTSDQAFRIVYPEGALVTDSRSGRQVSLVATSSGELRPRRTGAHPDSSRWEWKIAAIIGLVLICATIALYVRLRR